MSSVQRVGLLGGIVLGLCLAPVAMADVNVTFDCSQDCPDPGMEKCGGEVNISGATLFVSFFTVNASTNDFIDPNCNGTGTVRAIENLAPPFTNPWNGWWLVQYRGVGSGNGLKEFVNSQVDGQTPTVTPVDNGYINRFLYYDGETGTIYNPWGCDMPGACCVAGECTLEWEDDCTTLGGTFLGEGTVCEPNPCDPQTVVGACTYMEEGEEVCTRETAGDCAVLAGTYAGDGTVCEVCCDTGTPYCPTYIDLAIMDVPTRWFVKQPDGAEQATWDRNPGLPGYGMCPFTSWDMGQSNQLKSLCAPSGNCLNIDTATPDANTVYDTSVAWVPIGIICSRGTGIGLGAKSRAEGEITSSELQHLFTTGRLPNGENLVAATRDSGSGTRNGGMNSLGLDPSWARGDNLRKKSKDSQTDLLGPLHQATNKGGSSRMEGAVQNRRLAVGYTGLIGSSRAIADSSTNKYEILSVKFDHQPGFDGNYTRPTLDNVLDNSYANPNAWQIGGPETFASLGDPKGIGPAMANEAAADYLNNITESIAAFTTVPGDPATNGTPGEYLAENYILSAATDAVPNPTNPGEFITNSDLNQSVQNYIRTHNNGFVLLTDYGVNGRNNKVPTRLENPDWPPFGDPASDPGFPEDGEYDDGESGPYLNRHNGDDIAGGTDLNLRNRIMGDFDGNGLRDINDVEKMMEAYYDRTAYTLANSTPGDPVVVEIIGDFTGDGNFTDADIRYFADGLAIDATGKLNRKEAFLRIDQKWALLTGGDDNFFDTEICSVEQGAGYWIPGASYADVAGSTPWPGADPHGHDGVVDCNDTDYVRANFGMWTNLAEAITMDLSCDMNGNLVIDEADVAEVGTVMGNPNANCRPGDMDNDGDVDFDDINLFVSALGAPADFYAAYPTGVYSNGDCDGDCDVDFDDINPFVELIGATYP